MTTKSVTILGSTGSIGVNTLDLISRDMAAYEMIALTAHKNVERLIEQARKFKPEMAVIGDPGLYDALKEGLAGTNIQALAGNQAIIEAASAPASWVMAGIVGAAGLKPTLAAIRRGATVGLANKECLVCAGDFVMAEVKKSGATLLPVDSEHNAIFQVYEFDKNKSIRRIILTASGGPFRTRTRAEMEGITPAEAVAHPNWDMGAKISVDSATLMNKGLEMIEAYHLFPVKVSQIDVLVHPQSVVHSMVEYIDGSVLAQMGSPDMRTAISYALAWPERMETPVEQLDLAKIGQLTFEAPDPVRFPALRLAREALEEGGSAPTVLNAANEVAVHTFLDNRLKFLDICRVVEDTLEAIQNRPVSSLEDVFQLDEESRRTAGDLLKKLN
ncbi:MAG: 1-deoxy-D-xylulose-5-phosphate reductoisomerase [Proteobacteria bacterium]|nr:1-deoxy-D-xylulose-5-phosphate reductoisomerase [Pseudomonadota bacterium]